MLIDRVDGADRPVGVVARRRAFVEGANFRTVHALLFDEAGRLLLQQLGRERARHPLRWGSSVAGYLHAGESYEEAIRRRTREELGVAPAFRPHGRTAVVDQGVTKFVGVFEARVRADEPQVHEPDHIEQLRWVPVDRLSVELVAEPERFTDTFRRVFAYWRSRRRP